MQLRSTGVDLSKILEGFLCLGEQNVIKTDKCTGVSQLLVARTGLPPKSTPMFRFQRDKLHGKHHHHRRSGRF